MYTPACATFKTYVELVAPLIVSQIVPSTLDCQRYARVGEPIQVPLVTDKVPPTRSGPEMTGVRVFPTIVTRPRDGLTATAEPSKVDPVT